MSLCCIQNIIVCQQCPATLSANIPYLPGTCWHLSDYVLKQKSAAHMDWTCLLSTFLFLMQNSFRLFAFCKSEATWRKMYILRLIWSQQTAFGCGGVYKSSTCQSHSAFYEIPIFLLICLSSGSARAWSIAKPWLIKWLQVPLNASWQRSPSPPSHSYRYQCTRH